MNSTSLKIIKTEKDYKEALKMAYSLMDAKPDTKRGVELELLTFLIEKYEEEHFPIDMPDPVAAIKFRMEQEDLTVSDLGKVIGYKSRASEILSYKRKLTLPMIRKISEFLKIPPSVLIQAY